MQLWLQPHGVLASTQTFFDSSRNPLKRTNGGGTRDEATRTSAWENNGVFIQVKAV